MKHYDDESRGTIQREDCFKQPISFKGMLFNGRNGMPNVSPTDIDGYIQLDNEKCHIFFELKYSGNASVGQLGAFEKLVDAISPDRADGILFIAKHSTDLPQTIEAKSAIVERIYWRGRGYPITSGKTLFEYIGNYIKWRRSEVSKRKTS